MACVKKDEVDGLYRVYDTECSGVLAGPYETAEAAQAMADELNDE